MIRKIKMALGGALAGLVGFFWIAFQRRAAQRDQAKRERDIARSSKEAVDAANESAKRVQEASHAQLQRNEQARQKRRDKEPSDRFVGRLDTSRLRNRSDD